MSDTSPLPPEAYKALADLLGGSGKVIAYRSYFAHAFGGACNAILLSQFWFWSNTPTVKTRAGGWFWKSQKEITLETGLTRTETATTRRKLIALGVLKEDNRGCPATLHYQVVKDVLYEVLWVHILKNPEEFDEILQSAGVVQNLQTGSPKTSKVTRGKRVNQNPQKLQAITETSSEKTKRINQRVAPAGAPKADKISSLSLSQIAEQKEQKEQEKPVPIPVPEKKMPIDWDSLGDKQQPFMLLAEKEFMDIYRALGKTPPYVVIKGRAQTLYNMTIQKGVAE